MKIGIVVFSQTGNTYSVAQRLNETLLAAGHTVALERVTAVDDKQKEVSKIQFDTKPDVNKYDTLIFGAPVWGFSLSTVMAAYLSQAATLQGKKVFCFVTQGSPYAWMGGNRAVGQLKNLCESKGAEVLETGIVNWPSKQRENKINDLIKKVGGLF